MSDTPSFTPPVIDWKAHIAAVQAYLKDRGNKIDWKQIYFGEAFTGDGAIVEMAHPSVVIGPIDGPVGIAAIGAFAGPQRGHTPMVAVFQPNLQCPILTVVVNEVTIGGANQAVLVGGPLQRAASDAVLHSMQAGLLPSNPGTYHSLAIVFQGFIHWEAKDTDRVYWWNYDAMVTCIVRALTRSPSLEAVIKERAKHPYCDIATAEFPSDVEPLKLSETMN